MPPPPEIADIPAQVWMPEIFWQLETERAGDSNRHIGIAREVVINLRCIRERRHPTGSRGIEFRILIDGIDVDAQGIGEERFLQKSAQEKLRAGPNVLHTKRMNRSELRQKSASSNNWAGDQLRKERNEEGEIPKAPGWRQHSTVHIDRVAHGLKGEERNPHRKDDVEMLWHPYPRDQERLAKTVHEEVHVLKETKDPQICAKTQDQPTPTNILGVRLGYPQSDIMIDRG